MRGEPDQSRLEPLLLNTSLLERRSGEYTRFELQLLELVFDAQELGGLTALEKAGVAEVMREAGLMLVERFEARKVG